MLSAYCCPTSAWQAAQLTFCVMVSHGRRRDGGDPGMALAAGLLHVHRAAHDEAVDIERPSVPGRLEVAPFMAAQAVAIGHPLVVEDPPGLVRLMAVDAGGKHVRLAFPQLALDHLAVHRLDGRMAARAGGGDVRAGNRRLAVRVRKDRVRRVARHARSRDHQSLVHEGIAVDALRIVGQDVGLVDRALPLHPRALGVALAAQERHAGRLHRGARILERQDLVGAVAVAAVRCEVVAAGNRLAMQRLVVLRLFCRVAAAAGGRLQCIVVREFLPFRSAWQSTHSFVPCTVASNFFWSTNSRTVRPARFLRGTCRRGS